jgi:hypothetical protein
MRLLRLILLFMAFSGVSFRQVPDQTENSVAALLKQLSSGYVTGFAEKPVNRLGDVAAVALTRIVADSKLSPKDVENMLVVLREAFGRPSIVVIESDRQPRTALFVLQYFDSLTVDAELKRKITDAKRYIVEQSHAASTPPSR